MKVLAALQHHAIGFFGMPGPLWFFIGLVFMIAVCVVVWKITDAIAKAVGIPGPWMVVIYWCFVLFCLIVFSNYAVGHWW